MAMVVGVVRVQLGFGRLSFGEAELLCPVQPCLSSPSPSPLPLPAACCNMAIASRGGLNGLKLAEGGLDQFGMRGNTPRVCFPVSLLHGLGGALWDGGDNENSTSSDQFSSWNRSFKQRDKLALLSIIQQIEPLDVSHVSKDVSAECMDAMIRTISGMLGLLPSDQFEVTVEASNEALARLLVSSMMTGYTLRNAEYRLCLQRSLDRSEEATSEEQPREEEAWKILPDYGGHLPSGEFFEANPHLSCNLFEDMMLEDGELHEKLGLLSPEVKNHIRELQSRLEIVHKELENCKQAKTALEMEKIVGDEKNDLLDYLRSLPTDKVAELSRPVLPEVEEVVQTIVDSLLESVCSSQASKMGPLHSNGATLGCQLKNRLSSPELLGSVPLQSQSCLMASRDYLARFLFWCMLLGHYMRSVEYRFELSHTLTLKSPGSRSPR